MTGLEADFLSLSLFESKESTEKEKCLDDFEIVFVATTSGLLDGDRESVGCLSCIPMIFNGTGDSL